jgi:predicted CoA-binding protein
VTRDPDLYGDDARAVRLLRDTEVWAVVGLSDSVIRPAYGVARLLQSKGKRIVPIHLTARSVHGERGYATLADAVFEIGQIDVVDMFVNSTRVGAVVDQAIAIGAQAVWLQLGVIDEAAAQRARSGGLDVIMDRCPTLEWSRLGPRPV